MFITVLHGDNQRSLFNTQCKTAALLDWMKLKCECEHDAEIDLANLNGQVMNLPHHQYTAASDILRQREEYILISISRIIDPSKPSPTSLLHNCDLHDPQCLVKLRKRKTEQEACATAEESRLSRTLTSSLSTENQPRPYKQIRFSSASTCQTNPV